jgi:hypothetical protein
LEKIPGSAESIAGKPTNPLVFMVFQTRHSRKAGVRLGSRCLAVDFPADARHGGKYWVVGGAAGIAIVKRWGFR